MIDIDITVKNVINIKSRVVIEKKLTLLGLFPLLGHAAMNIRPTLLTIYESHFVPLRERLRPALSGFLSGVLPGLETGSDHFERCFNDIFFKFMFIFVF